MGCVVGLSKSRRKHDSIWVIMDQMTKSTDFIPVIYTYKAEDYLRLYIDEIVRRHGILLSVSLDREDQFTSHFLRSFKKNIGTQVKLSIAFHPQTDGQAECTVHTQEDKLRVCAIYFRGSWDDHMILIELSYNNNYHSRKEWHRLRIYMAEVVGLQQDGSRLEIHPFLVQRSFMRPYRRLE